MGIFVKKGNGNVLGLIKVIMSGVQHVNDLFYAFYSQKKYEIVFSGQIIYLKRYLNDQFDPINRQIWISTNSGFFSEFYYRVAEDLGEYHYRVSEGLGPRLSRVNENATEFDFTVWVPDTLIYDASQFNASVNKYKLSDKTFEIQTYTP